MKNLLFLLLTVFIAGSAFIVTKENSIIKGKNGNEYPSDFGKNKQPLLIVLPEKEKQIKVLKEQVALHYKGSVEFMDMNNYNAHQDDRDNYRFVWVIKKISGETVYHLITLIDLHNKDRKYEYMASAIFKIGVMQQLQEMEDVRLKTQE